VCCAQNGHPARNAVPAAACENGVAIRGGRGGCLTREADFNVVEDGGGRDSASAVCGAGLNDVWRGTGPAGPRFHTATRDSNKRYGGAVGNTDFF
jgi:hypothetical protein